MLDFAQHQQQGLFPYDAFELCVQFWPHDYVDEAGFILQSDGGDSICIGDEGLVCPCVSKGKLIVIRDLWKN